jgi:hypothetical protein
MEHIMTGTHSKEFWIRQIEIAGLDNVSYSLEMAEFNREYEQCAVIKEAIEQFNNR